MNYEDTKYVFDRLNIQDKDVVIDDPNGGDFYGITKDIIVDTLVVVSVSIYLPRDLDILVKRDQEEYAYDLGYSSWNDLTLEEQEDFEPIYNPEDSLALGIHTTEYNPEKLLDFILEFTSFNVIDTGVDEEDAYVIFDETYKNLSDVQTLINSAFQALDYLVDSNFETDIIEI